jgi:hypothetical protein
VGAIKLASIITHTAQYFYPILTNSHFPHKLYILGQYRISHKCSGLPAPIHAERQTDGRMDVRTEGRTDNMENVTSFFGNTRKASSGVSHTRARAPAHTNAQGNSPAPYSLISLTLDCERIELLLLSLGKYFYHIIAICSIFLQSPLKSDTPYSLL